MGSKKYDLVISGGRVVDPALGFGKDAFVFIKDGLIAGIETDSAAVQRTLKSFDDETKKAEDEGDTPSQ